MEGLWQKSLRRATFGSNVPAGAHKQPEKLAKERKLSVIDEDSSRSHPDKAQTLANDVVDTAIHSRAIKGKTAAPNKKSLSLKNIPNLLRGSDSVFLSRPEDSQPPISPIPLPPGVICIDQESDSTQTYASDIVLYARHRERSFRQSLMTGSSNFHVSSRNLLACWLIEVLHFFKTSQATVYHAINLLDHTLSKWDVPHEQLQLVGICCVLIATKLEEYYPANIKGLLKCTRNSYRSSEVIKMERIIYRCVSFRCFGEEPTVFVDRCIAAAFREGDRMFKELCMFLLDTIIPNHTKWSNLASRKASAAVYAALHIPLSDDKDLRFDLAEEVWTPTLRYYSNYEKSELVSLSCFMLEVMKVVVDIINHTPEKEDELVNGVLVKYLSQSRHRGLLRHPVMSKENANNALARILKKSD